MRMGCLQSCIIQWSVIHIDYDVNSIPCVCAIKCKHIHRNINGLIDNKIVAYRFFQASMYCWDQLNYINNTNPSFLSLYLYPLTPEWPLALVKIPTFSSISQNFQRISHIFFQTSPGSYIYHHHSLLISPCSLSIAASDSLCHSVPQSSTRALSLVPGSRLSHTLPPPPTGLCHWCPGTLKWPKLWRMGKNVQIPFVSYSITHNTNLIKWNHLLHLYLQSSLYVGLWH